LSLCEPDAEKIDVGMDKLGSELRFWLGRPSLLPNSAEWWCVIVRWWLKLSSIKPSILTEGTLLFAAAAAAGDVVVAAADELEEAMGIDSTLIEGDANESPSSPWCCGVPIMGWPPPLLLLLPNDRNALVLVAWSSCCWLSWWGW